MKFSIGDILKNSAKIISIAKKYKSDPKGAINEALAILDKKDHEKAKLVAKAINSGKQPLDVIKEQAKNGNINSKDLDTIKNVYSMFSKDIPQKVPNNVWEEVDSAMKSNSTGSAGNSVFSGF